MTITLRASRKHRAGRAALRNVALFADCSDTELALVQSLLTKVEIPAGEVPVREGRLGREFLVVVDGELAAARDGAPLGVLGPGSVVGEMALLDRAPRSASVTALTPVTAYVGNTREFASLLAAVPSVRAKVEAAAAERAAANAA